jgi:hypothetical protein
MNAKLLSLAAAGLLAGAFAYAQPGPPPQGDPQRPQGPPQPPAPEEIFKLIDANSDGQVSLEEFVEHHKQRQLQRPGFGRGGRPPGGAPGFGPPPPPQGGPQGGQWGPPPQGGYGPPMSGPGMGPGRGRGRGLGPGLRGPGAGWRGQMGACPWMPGPPPADEVESAPADDAAADDASPEA